ANVRRAGLNLPCQQALPAAPNHRRQNLKTDQSKENPDRRRVGHAVSRRVGLEHAPRSHEQIEQSLQRAKVESERILDGVVQIIALLWFTHASPHLQAAYNLSHSSASISAVKPRHPPKSIQHLQSALTLSASRRAESSWIPVRTNFEAMQLSVMPRRSSSERRRAEARPIKRPGAHRGTLANTTSRTPPAHRAKGVKDLHVPGRRPPIATERV